MEEVNTNTSRVRIYVGGLGESVMDNDLQRLFGSLGRIDGVDMIRTKGRSFAYVDFIPSPTDEKSLPKLFSRYNGCLWKGGKLKLEKAKEHYLERLRREWAEDTEIVSNEPETSVDPDRGISCGKIPDRESLKTKQLRIFFPKLRKVKSIPFGGTGKHKYSFQNVEAPPLPVHFCDCEEHSSPTATARGKCYNREAESGGMNDEEISMMNAVMNKLFEKEKVSNTMHGEKEQTSHESRDDLQSDDYEADSASDEDDIIINMETEKKKTALIGSEELARMLENQESGLNKTRISEEDPNKSKLELQKKNNITPGTKKKPHLTSERERNVKTFTSPGKTRLMQNLPNEQGSGVQPAARDGFGESVKASWSQKSSWRELINDADNSAFSASQIMPDFGSSKEEQQQGAGDACTPGSPNNKTDNTTDGDLGNSPSDMEAIKELTEGQPTNKVASSNQSGRGASWLRKQSWTQMVGGNNATFSISQILPDISFPKPGMVEPIVDFAEPMAKEPIADSTISNGCKHHVLGKHPDKESVRGGYNSVKSIQEKDQHSRGNKCTSASLVEGKAEKAPIETSAADVKIGETCSFMRSATSLREWAKAKAALSGSLKRKRSEK